MRMTLDADYVDIHPGSTASLSETTLLSATRHAPLSVEDEGEKLEDNAQNSFTRTDTRRGQ